eukprot:Lankesteria_metandrocarpae@DN557_c0_g1_i1.p1
MGKNQHSKDKLYIVASEYARDWGGYKKAKNALPFKSLPFNCCGLSLLPFENPVCTNEGIVFDVDNILAYIKKYARNPVNGLALSVSELIPLHFHKNAEGAYHCPVTYKVFSDHSHIVANRKSGHVYLYESIDTLCRKAKNWFDLLTDAPFTSHDLVTIQNPKEVKLRSINDFDYIVKGLDPIADFSGIESEAGSLTASIRPTEMMQRIFDKVGAESEHGAAATGSTKQVPVVSSSSTGNIVKSTAANAVPQHKSSEPPAPAGVVSGSSRSVTANTGPAQIVREIQKPKHSLYTTHTQAAGFTSTVIDQDFTKAAKTEYRDVTDTELRESLYKEVKKRGLKGYVRVTTSLGALNIQLNADIAPMACDNFIKHAESGYYERTIFHRCIANFMIQGGDPTGSGKGGKSAFEGGKPFNDEFHPKYTHAGTGVVSMANSGKNSNKSQFFITFKSCDHLDNKHTVFGKVVGGIEVLKAMEKLETNKETDRPKNPPKLESVTVFKNPFVEVEESTKKEAEEKRSKEAYHNATKDMPWFSNINALEGVVDAGPSEIGKYLKTPAPQAKRHKPGVV